VDTRLRPRGQEGELVVTLEEFLNYIAEDAQAWELLTYLKAHPLAGNPQLGQDGRGIGSRRRFTTAFGL
jgi:[glutamine synthetase] adenylyltransferase / [glutamine synthetase]-adenylyl-L-tyrosine phosphorylase